MIFYMFQNLGDRKQFFIYRFGATHTDDGSPTVSSEHFSVRL